MASGNSRERLSSVVADNYDQMEATTSAAASSTQALVRKGPPTPRLLEVTALSVIGVQAEFALRESSGLNVCKRVVLLACRLPVAGVKTEVEAEQQSTTTDQKGMARMVLQQGSHTVRLMHPDLTLGWVEQQIEITSMEPRLLLQLRPRRRFWRAPILVCGHSYGDNLWLAPVNARCPDTEWHPFTGHLRVMDGSRMDVVDGVFNAGQGLVEILDEKTLLRPESTDPIARLEPSLPFERLVEEVDDDHGTRRLLKTHYGPPDAALLMQPTWGPLHLGIQVQPPSPPLLGIHSPLVLRALTACCGHGVLGFMASCGNWGSTSNAKRAWYSQTSRRRLASH